MPVYLRTKINGNKRLFFYQYGNSGKSYYFNPNDRTSQLKAYEKAIRQAKAIHYSQSRQLKSS